MDKTDRIYVAGHRGLVGSAVCRSLESRGWNTILTRTSQDLDLRHRPAVDDFFSSQRPRYVILAAARVGGIQANMIRPAEFIRDNLQIQTNVIDAAYKYDVEKLVFLGSSCIYPKEVSQPIREKYLLTGQLEPTNQWYAVAKIAGIKMCQAYREQFCFRAISLMPTNLYGPGDNFDLESAHVLPALIRKFHEAKVNGSDSVRVWGSGNPRREFLHVDDLARAVLFLMESYDDSEIINVGTGQDISIRHLAEMTSNAVGYEGKVCFDLSMPDGTLRKLLDVSRINALGWRYEIALNMGIESTYAWFLEHQEQFRH